MSSPYPPQYDSYGQPPNFPSPGGYYIPPSGDPRYGIRPPATSVLAILSMIGGIVSLLVSWMTCCCFFSPFVFTSSIVSIVMGHVALAQIQRSMVSLGGREMAFVGLVTGYPAAVISGFFLGLLVFSMSSSQVPPPAPLATVVTSTAGETELEAAEKKIASDRYGAAHGNSPAAIALAEQFNKRMLAQRDALATEDSTLGIVAEGGTFITWCELRDGRCAFITHVPLYRDYNSAGKGKIEKVAWTTAQEVVRGTVAEGADLAVGTKGILLWGHIMIGKTVAENSSETGLLTSPGEEDYELLFPFFAPLKPAAEMEDGAIKLPEESH